MAWDIVGFKVLHVAGIFQHGFFLEVPEAVNLGRYKTLFIKFPTDGNQFLHWTQNPQHLIAS